MKKPLAMLLALTMAFTMAGCAGGSSTESKDSTASEDTAEAKENTDTEEAADTSEDTDSEAGADVMSYDEYMAADLDSQVTVQAYVQAKQSWYEDKATVYAQDKDGGYFFYDMACPEDEYDLLTPGTKIQVTGYKSEWSGETEIMDGSFQIIDDGDTYVADPLDVTQMLGTDELINYQNQFVSFKGMTVEAAGQDANGNDVPFLYNYDGSGTEGDDLYFNASYNGQTYTFTIESYLCDSST